MKEFNANFYVEHMKSIQKVLYSKEGLFYIYEDGVWKVRNDREILKRLNDVNQGLLLKNYNEEITFYYDERNGSKLTDYISNNLDWFIISPKFKNILENVGVNNVQYIPIEIKEKSSKDIITGYSIVIIVGLVDGLNLDESVYKVLKVRDQEHISVTKPALDSNKLNGLDLARVKNYIFATFISDVLKKELKKKRITGCDFLEVDMV